MNIVGLTIGMVVGIMILNYVSFEFSYDKSYEKGDRIYRVESQFYDGNELINDWATSSSGYAPALKRHFQEIEDFVRIDVSNTERVVSYKGKKFREDKVVVTDPSFFSMFSPSLIEGSIEDALLHGPNKVVITKSIAKKYFGDINPIGKPLKISTSSKVLNCQVTGVLDEFPENSSFNYDILISWESLPLWLRDFWYKHEVYSFVLLAKNASKNKIENNFSKISEQYKTKQSLKNKRWGIQLNPLENIHLSPQKQYESEIKGNYKGIVLLILVAFAILIIAWMNYIILATVLSLERSKEVGIKKFLGVGINQLREQFMFEALIINSISLILAIVVVRLASPFFNSFLGKDTSIVISNEPVFLGSLIGVFFIGVFLSGFYPSFVLSSVKLINLLKGKYINSKNGSILRKSLVIFQFTIVIILISGVITIFKQFKYMEKEPLGVDIEKVLTFKLPAKTKNLKKKMNSFLEGIKNLREVSSVTISNAVPGMEVGTFLSNHKAEDAIADNKLFEMHSVDYNYIKTYKLEIINGRDFSEDIIGDHNRIIINEEAVKELGYRNNESAINKKIILEGAKKAVEIIGVVKNYHQQGLNKLYTPTMMFLHKRIKWINLKFISVKIKNSDFVHTNSKIQPLWNRFFPDSPFDYFQVNTFYEKQYENDRKFNKVFVIFTFLSIFIASFGLWTLAMFEVLLIGKDLAIRKILGASTKGLFFGLLKKFIYLTFISIFIGIPIAYFLIRNWLNNYTFRIELNWGIFILASTITLLICFLSVCWQTYRVATKNPIKLLRN